VKPLSVFCHLDGGSEVLARHRRIQLDALLAAAVAEVSGLPPARAPEDVMPIEIPVAKEPGGRFHLCSCLMGDVELEEVRYVQRRFPVEQALHRSNMKSVNLSAGPRKNYRIPHASLRFREDLLVGHLIGDRDDVLRLLQTRTHVGGRRSVGAGRLDPEAWSVLPVEPWEGFPVVSPEGLPLRPLPEDWPGIAEGAKKTFSRLTYPYWLRQDEVVAWVP